MEKGESVMNNEYGNTLTLAPIGVGTGPALNDYDDYLMEDYDPREGLGEYEGFQAESAWDAVDFSRDSQVYIEQEESMGFLKAQFQSYRSWWEILGLSYNMTNVAQSGKLGGAAQGGCCSNWERIFGIPKLGHLIQMTRDAQLSYVNGIQDEVKESGTKKFGLSDIEGIEWDQLQFFYADIITARENIWSTLIEQIEAGTTRRTPLEMEALAIATNWKNAIAAGGSSRQQALAEAGISGGSTQTLSPLPISRSSLGGVLPLATLPPWQKLASFGGAAYIIYKLVVRR